VRSSLEVQVLLYHSDMVTPAWLPIAISALGVVISMSALWWQVRRARFNQSIDLLFRLEGDFFGAAKRAQRVKAAAGLLEGQPLEAEPILDFFETMALLLRRGALDEEIVWHTFFYWIDHYYEACRDAIAARQNQDPLVWRDLAELISKLRKLQTSERGSASYRPPTAAEIQAFLTEELTEAA
jgi:hypothetical protein